MYMYNNRHLHNNMDHLSQHLHRFIHTILNSPDLHANSPDKGNSNVQLPQPHTQLVQQQYNLSRSRSGTA